MMLVNRVFSSMLFNSLVYLLMDNYNTIVETYVRSDTRKDKQKMLSTLNQDYYDQFDFVIVGCGSAGTHLAKSLSRNHRVLVLEVGGLQDPMLNIPANSFLLTDLYSIDFEHVTVPQKKAAFALKNNVSHWPAAKLLGGSSTVSLLEYNRGNVQGFDEMATELGDGKWSTEHLLEYYNKIENYNNGWYNENHRRRGTMDIEKSPKTKLVNKFRDGAVEMGLPVRDPNYGPKNTEGFSFVDNHMKFGRRNNAYEENIRPILKSRRNKLVIRKYSLVTKINFEMENQTYRAVGVTYERHGRIFDVRARKEVIVSAGALGTAKLLMLSGIGPKEDLEKIGIHCLVDLPVGQSMQEAYGVTLGPVLVDKGYSFIRERDVTIQSTIEWTMNGTGPIASSRIEASYDLISNFSKSKAIEEGKPVPDKPDIHTILVAASADDQTERSATDYGRSYNLNQKAREFFTRTIGEDSYYLMVILSSPKQRGYVKLRDANPWTSLEINPRYFENDHDMEVVKEGMRFALKLAETTESMKSIESRLIRIPFPDCESHEFTWETISDDYLECLARHTTFTMFRYCSTAPVGPISNSGKSNATVVDADFRVKNVQNLRVVDASVLQLKYVTVSDATVRMLGEFAADVILKYYTNMENSDTW